MKLPYGNWISHWIPRRYRSKIEVHGIASFISHYSTGIQYTLCCLGNSVLTPSVSPCDSRFITLHHGRINAPVFIQYISWNSFPVYTCCHSMSLRKLIYRTGANSECTDSDPDSGHLLLWLLFPCKLVMTAVLHVHSRSPHITITSLMVIW